MNSNRKADIQRRLTLTAVPTPPDGLADRIKGDIPKYLAAMEAERRQFSRSLNLTLRIAASIVLLVTSLVVTMRVLSPANEVASYPKTAVAAPPQKEELKDVTETTAAVAVDELRVDISEEPRPAMQVAQTTTVDDLRARRDEPEPARERDAERFIVDGLDAAAGGRVGGSAAPASSVQIAEAAPRPALAGAPPPQVMQNVTAVESAEGSAPASRAASSKLVKEAFAADLDLGPKSTVFGISVDPQAFERVKDTIESGSRVEASAINVEALVNYFAGSPKRVRRDVDLEAEGSPAPVGTTARRGYVRFTIDTRTEEIERNATVPPIATNARVDIEFNPRAVESFHRIGVDDDVAPEATLFANTSVTGLYGVVLKEEVRPSTRIATVTLRYKSIADGRDKSRFVVVRGSDFARKWTRASQRHRLASLGAVWGESLKEGGSGGASDVASKAEELATQAPHDSRARALATVTKVGTEQ